MPRTLTLRSTSTDALVIADRNNLRDRRKFWGVRNNTGVLGFCLLSDPNTTHVDVGDKYAYLKYAVSNRVRTITAAGASNLIYQEHTVFCNATAGAQTINFVSTANATPGGRVHIIKKIAGDPANTVIVDMAGSETIDGAATVTLTNVGDYIVIQTDGTNWFRIGGNV